MNYKYNKYKIKYLELTNSEIINQSGGDLYNFIDGYKIIKEMGKGMHGTVYLIEYTETKKQYAMKVEQIFKKDVKKTTKSPVWREIDFSNILANKYPQQFMKIYKYENKKCNYVHNLDENKWNSLDKNAVKYYKKLFASPYCSIKITSIVDDILHDIIYKIDDKKIILDLFIQVCYIAFLINKENYYHRDFHPKNIGVIFTKEKYITILNNKIETHGYILVAIDYGMVLHKKYELENWEKNALKYDNDLYQIFYKIIFKIMLKNLINKYPEKNINQIVSISKEDAETLGKYLKNIKIDNSKWIKDNYKYFEELLYKILYFDKFQDQLEIKNKVDLFSFISIDSVLYIIENYYNLENVLKHLINLRNNKNIKLSDTKTIELNEKYLFIMFQGNGTSIKSWNENTESKFLDKLKTIGDVYTYQDKIQNIWYYNKSEPDYIDFDSDIDFDLSYIDIDKHVKMIFNDLQNKYINLEKYKLIPVGWSAGCYLALYFAQLYSKLCKLVILLDSSLWTSKNIKKRLKELKNDKAGYEYPITNNKYKKMLNDWKINHTDIENAYKINNTNNIIRTVFTEKHLNLKLPVKTLSFINIQKPEKNEWSKDFNNKTRLDEVKILQNKNPDKYIAYILENKSHYIFNKKSASNFIMSKIKLNL